MSKVIEAIINSVPKAEAVNIIREHPFFDAQWYVNKYLDVQLLGADPAQHFLTYGRLLERSPSPEFDTRFYISRYADVGSENPLLHYSRLGGRDAERPLTPRQLREQIVLLKKEMSETWQPKCPRVPQNGRPVISYCIPLMGRMGDIQITLSDNLSAHRDMVDRVEFIVVIFCDDGSISNWIASHFSSDIASGLLRVVRDDDTLDSWHFGKAKNAFRPHISGEIYSSLDGDNFVSEEETRRLLEVRERYAGHFLMHHFSGEWGDGTSGRISVPTEIYRAVGYDPLLLPRQFDEIDLILRALKRFPAMPFVCRSMEKNIFTKSSHARQFREDECLPNRIVTFEDYAHRPPANPRGGEYVSKTAYLKHMGNVNAAISALSNGLNAKKAALLTSRLTNDKHQFLDAIPREAAIDTFFRVKSDRRQVIPTAISAFLVVKNEEHFLSPLLQHYRKLGVGNFFIVDDGSDKPVRTLVDAPDVHVFEPKVGTFRTFKTAWIEALAKAYLPEGAWILTIDADEFIQMPYGFSDFVELAFWLEENNKFYLPGLMMDLLPGPGIVPAQLENAERDFAKLFTHCANFCGPASEEYKTHSSIAWAFGAYADLSWRIDIRYHLFGTIDSLRKIPLIRYIKGCHLNQGFHSLHYTDGSKALGHEVWKSRPLLPVYHYKLIRLFSDQARTRMLKEAGNYHERTEANLKRIFAGGDFEILAELARISNHIAPIEDVCKTFGTGELDGLTLPPSFIQI